MLKEEDLDSIEALKAIITRRVSTFLRSWSPEDRYVAFRVLIQEINNQLALITINEEMEATKKIPQLQNVHKTAIWRLNGRPPCRVEITGISGGRKFYLVATNPLNFAGLAYAKPEELEINECNCEDDYLCTGCKRMSEEPRDSM